MKIKIDTLEFEAKIRKAEVALKALEAALKEIPRPLFYSKHSKRTIYAKSRHI